MRRIAIVGASLAGVSAIESLRDRGYEHEIVLIGADPHLPYNRPPLSKQALAGSDYDTTQLHPQEWYDERGVELQLGTEVVSLNTQNKELRTNGGKVLKFDGLLIATGSKARPLGTRCPGLPVHKLRTLEDSRQLHAELTPGKHLVIIGAGFIGLEVASTARQLGLDVTLVEVANVPLGRAFGPSVGDWFRRLQERNGVQVRCATTLESIERSGRGVILRFSAGHQIEADLVLAGIGASPATGWLANSGVNISDGIVCGPDLQTSMPGIVAAGDVARWRNPLFDEEMRIEHWTNAMEQGRHAAGTLLGSREAFGAVPYFWTDQFKAKMRFVGRAHSTDKVVIEEESDDSLVAIFGRAGVVSGAVCVNAPRRLAHYRKAVLDRVPWRDVVRDSALVR